MNWPYESWTLPLAILLFSLNLITLQTVDDNSNFYSEIATVTYLPNQNILTDINFKSSQYFQSLNSDVLNLGSFPGLIYTFPTEFGVFDGKISFTRGRWDSSVWAKPPNNPTSSGFQFHGHFKKNLSSNFSLEDRYNKMISLISGYFCASLNVLKFSDAIKPTLPSFPSSSETVNHELNEFIVLAGIVPGEPVCIENLQPWLDLLPCNNFAGLASMLKPESIYQSDFHSLELSFSVNCLDGLELCKNIKIEMILNMITVFDLNRWNRNQQWTLKNLLGRSFKKACPIKGHKPIVLLRIPDNQQYIDTLHQQKDQMSSENGVLTVQYNEKDLLNEIGASGIPILNHPLDSSHLFRAYRFKSGSTDDTGGFGLVLENNYSTSIQVTVIESIPWFFGVFLHQTEFSLNSKSIPSHLLSTILKEFLIEPAVNRKRSLLIQSKWILPPNSKIQIYFPFEREFLRFDEFPLNSERGIELSGALIFFSEAEAEDVDDNNNNNNNNNNNDFLKYSLTTNTLLFTWPMPDATMPFNVITMTSTVAALFYGAFFNLIFRRFYLKHPTDPPPGFLPKIIWKIKKFVFKLKSHNKTK